MKTNKFINKQSAALIFVTCQFVGQTSVAIGRCETIHRLAVNQLSASPLFRDSKPARLEIAADFTKIYQISQRKSFTESLDKGADRFLTDARVTNLENPTESVAASIRPRGNTSLMKGEASFPKLRVEIKEVESLKGLTFQGARNFRINTHVATNPKKSHTPFGRLNNENSPLREGLAYSLARTLGLTTPATRLAEIHYIDTRSGSDFSRHALLIETDKNMAKRMNSVVVEANEFIAAKKTNIDPLEGAKFHLFHKMIGNDDVGLRVHESVVSQLEGSYRPVWNTTLLKDEAGRITPTVYDLDVSSFVAGYALAQKGSFNNPYFNLNSHEQSMFVFRFLEIRQRFTQTELKTAIQYFKSKKQDLYRLVREASVDAEGKENALLHLDTFFANIDGAMSLPVITAERVPFWSDTTQSKGKLRQDPIEGELSDPGYLRPGTPVVVLGQEGSFLKVAILNINYDLNPGESSVGYIPADAPIGKTLPAKLIGRIDYRDLIRPEY